MHRERLDKVLSNHGFGTRKNVKGLLHGRRVCLNGTIVTDASSHMDTDTDILSVDGEPVALLPYIYLMMNKPAGTVCSTKEGTHETVFELLEEKYHRNLPGGELHLVGRLDVDTEGLLLFTTDGNLTHRLTSPKTHVNKTYFVKLRDRVDMDSRQIYSDKFLQGLSVEPEGSAAGFVCKKALIKWQQDDSFPEDMKTDAALLTIFEGKYHQVKRMFSTVGNEVVYLKRVSIGSLALDRKLAPGEYRELSADELDLLQ
jgi:16S rRNA pseudouridine516 synthase